MSWGFRKRIKIIPGVHINLSGKGISTTIGIPGASINVNQDGIHHNLGIPGTGLYSKDKIINYKVKNRKEEYQYIPDPAALIEDRIAYAKYYIGAIENEATGIRKMHADGFFTDEELEYKMIEFSNDAEYLEMKSFLESLEFNEPAAEDATIPILLYDSVAITSDPWYVRNFWLVIIMAVLLIMFCHSF